MKLSRRLKIGVSVVGLISALPLISGWAINNDNASGWLVRQGISTVPEMLSVQEIHSNLYDGIELQDVEFHGDGQFIKLKEVKLRWKLKDLFSKKLTINALILDGITVELTESTEKKDAPEIPFNLVLPLQISVENFLLTDAKITQDGATHSLEKLQFSAKTQGSQLYLHSLEIQAEGVVAKVKGETKLGGDFDFRLTTNWQFDRKEYGYFQGEISANGNKNAVNFDNQLSSPFVLNQQGHVENLATTPTISTTGKWQNLRYPLTGKTIQISSEKGDFTFTGTPQNYQVQLNAQTQPDKLPATQLKFRGNGTDQTIKIEQLELQSKIGHLNVSGDVGWKDAVSFDILATGLHFNPAIAIPEMVGDLNFKTQFKGAFLAEKLKLAIDIEYLTGKLRNYPVMAKGQLNLENDQLDIKTLSLTSGANKLTAQGKLGQKNAALDMTLNAPNLKGLWSTLGGQLNATAHFEGELTHPSVEMKADGKQLRFEQHAINHTTIDLNYAADGQKKSQFKLTSEGLSSGDTKIKSIVLSGQGFPKQHTLSAQVSAEQGDVDFALNGGLTDKKWQANFNVLKITQPLIGAWQLKNPTLLTLIKQNAGVEVEISESCFSQASASICLQGNYPANGNFQFGLHAFLPRELGQKYLPPNVKLVGNLNADANIQKNSSGLDGNYQLSLSKNSHLSVTVDKQLTTLPLNNVSLSGTLHGSQIDNKLDILFADKNYLRGDFRLNTDAEKAMSGQFTAAILDFSPLAPYLLPLTELKGHLTANVAISGTPAKPAVLGAISLNNAAVSVESAGIQLQSINLKLHTQANASEQILIDGSAKSGTGSLNVSGKLDLNPNLGYPANVLISGQQFEIIKLPEAHVLISPELNVTYAENKGTVSGKLNIDKADIKLAELPANAIVPSEDEEIVGQIKDVKTQTPAPKIGVDIAIDLGKQAHFSGLGLKTDLLGKLQLTKKDDALAMFGSVEMKKARYKSYGQDLTVRKGQFIFNGAPDNPFLDIEAIRLSNSKKVTAILKVTGELKTPQTQITSEPSLAESEALAYLITGKGLDQLTTGEGNMLANAALSYGAGQMSWIAEKFGIDELEVQQGDSLKGSLVAVGQYLTPDFYVGAKVGLFSKQTALTLKYKITDKFSISTQAGESQRVYMNYELTHD